MSVQKVSQVCWLLLVLVAVPSIAGAAKTAPSALPPEARAAFDEGMVAVGQQQWPAAIRYFNQAYKATPEVLQPSDRLAELFPAPDYKKESV